MGVGNAPRGYFNGKKSHETVQTSIDSAGARANNGAAGGCIPPG
jgi:hypothetical protein